MKLLPTQPCYEFGPFRLYPEEQLLLRDGAPVALQRKAFDTLLLLVEERGRLIEKEEFLRRVWAGTFVEEGSLTVNISLLRKALGAGRDGGGYIQTVPRRGYRFMVEVREQVPAAVAAEPAPAAAPSWRKSWRQRLTALLALPVLAFALATAGDLGLARQAQPVEPSTPCSRP